MSAAQSHPGWHELGRLLPLKTSGRIQYHPPHYQVDASTGCWNWLHPLDNHGYGHVYKDGRRRKAHRWYYELCHGPVSPELDIDHLCRNRRCVNPEHLEAVSHAENIRRGAQAKLTHEQVEKLRACDRSEVRVLAAELGVSFRHAKNLRMPSCRMWRTA